MSVMPASFLFSVRGVLFYDVNVSSVREGGRVAFQLEPTNVYHCHSNCVTLYIATSVPVSDICCMGHLASKVAASLPSTPIEIRIVHECQWFAEYH